MGGLAMSERSLSVAVGVDEVWRLWMRRRTSTVPRHERVGLIFCVLILIWIRM